jgi:hypothetical protein
MASGHEKVENPCPKLSDACSEFSEKFVTLNKHIPSTSRKLVLEQYA